MARLKKRKETISVTIVECQLKYLVKQLNGRFVNYEADGVVLCPFSYRTNGIHSCIYFFGHTAWRDEDSEAPDGDIAAITKEMQKEVSAVLKIMRQVNLSELFPRRRRK
jgi:hypothetical protein